MDARKTLMNENEAPRRDRIDLPASWAAKLPPLRGKRGGDPVAVYPS